MVLSSLLDARKLPSGEKASPETAQRLFGNNQLTFATALEKYKQGEAVLQGYEKQYDEYTDKLITGIKYISVTADSVSGMVKRAKRILRSDSSSPLGRLGGAAFIKERRKQLPPPP